MIVNLLLRRPDSFSVFNPFFQLFLGLLLLAAEVIGNVVSWQFFLHLLENESVYGSFLRWENRNEGIFRVFETLKVAALWRFYREKCGKGSKDKRILWAFLSRTLRSVAHTRL
jgi:hypothetical protein